MTDFSFILSNNTSCLKQILKPIILNVIYNKNYTYIYVYKL